ncbi:hypothetical protein HYH03_016293 [Edaphochlamys debaryana]|uniref:Protein kinase domain-containing protein n=1 Tax=Edaphochlamys debaryana TaxID=47281 RepID=A0A835XHS4_9CHLO|nr:hypothetical protein HYH03_016293 [Edaphochlamys debaryana]|eukprot:KAG2484907.1 hypothetical protein HYH03_016293 [Edaphochlamys debaryana]
MIEGSTGHIAVTVHNGASGNGVAANGVALNGNAGSRVVPSSAPLYPLRSEKDEGTSTGNGGLKGSTGATPQQNGQKTQASSVGVDTEVIKSVVQQNSMATLSDSFALGVLAKKLRHRGKLSDSGGTPKGGAGGHLKHSKTGWARRHAFLLAVRSDKKVLVVPLVVLIVALGLGLWGVLAAAGSERRARAAAAHNRAKDKAQTIVSELRACLLPVKVMQSFVARYPDFPTFNATFPSLADELTFFTAAGSIANMQLAPQGVVLAVHPLAGSEKAIGYNLLTDPRNQAVAYRTIEAHNLTLAGPYMLVQGFMGAPARFPIFVPNSAPNETFGLNFTAPNCSACYDPVTRSKFWGFATVLIQWDRFINGVVRIDELREQGLSYRLTRGEDTDSAVEVVMAGRDRPLKHPEMVEIPVPNNLWRLTVVDARGWEPAWMWPLVAMVVVMSVVLSTLVMLALVGRAQQRLLLTEVLSANEKLEEAARVLLQEKERMEALLKRQYNLIECLGGDPAGAEAEGGDVVGAEPQRSSNPAAKIEKMRKQLLHSLRMSHSGLGKGGSGGAAGAGGGGGGTGGGSGGPGAGGGGGGGISSDLVLREMIGEGTFGKVYRGLWRGTEVAIKTIILPANMSGKEKREKMAVMEAAISSSLAHPNVVATYTYQIKPLRDSSSDHGGGRPSDDLTASAIIVGGHNGNASMASVPPLEDPLLPFKADLDEAAGRGTAGVHSYEVQLVIEFCDKGCLREALDANLFFGQVGLNYPAILDTAADVAKALLHLHLNDVLHGDLKADNVMLKSCGGAGRGITAKVADFGLAIKIDPLSTHVSSTFQGTLTHMAPEVLLHGQVSKAADVYAFGVTLWEMFTGGYPYAGVPGALLGHLTSKEGKRPPWPPGTPGGFRELAEACWHRDAGQRPSFESILATLTALRGEQPGPTPSIQAYTPLSPEQRRAAKEKESGARPINGGAGPGGPASRSGALAVALRAQLEAAARADAARGSGNGGAGAGGGGAGGGAGRGGAGGAGGSGGAGGGTGGGEGGGGAASAPLPRLHRHYHHHRGKGAMPGRAPPPHAPAHASSENGTGSSPSAPGATSRLAMHHPSRPHSGGGGGSGRRSRSRARDDAIIMVGGRNVSLSNAITSKSVVLEPICETRYEGDPDAPTAHDPTTPLL